MKRSPLVSSIRASTVLVVLAVPGLGGCVPDTPHPIASRTDAYCRTCHVGRAGAPSSHNKTGCVSCHDSTTAGPYPALMPHPGGDADRCSLCHRDGTADAPVTKHLAETDCYTCHQAAQYEPWPPPVAHEVTEPDRASCLDKCHKDIEHAERPDCLDCHRL